MCPHQAEDAGCSDGPCGRALCPPLGRRPRPESRLGQPALRRRLKYSDKPKSGKWAVSSFTRSSTLPTGESENGKCVSASACPATRRRKGRTTSSEQCWRNRTTRTIERALVVVARRSGRGAGGGQRTHTHTHTSSSSLVVLALGAPGGGHTT